MSDNIENVEIYRNELKTPINADVKELKKLFSSYHDQDCCEDVAADWSPLENMSEEVGVLGTVNEISISSTPEMGFTIFFYNGEIAYGDKKRVGVFIPCHNIQNSYYSDKLNLVIEIE